MIKNGANISKNFNQQGLWKSKDFEKAREARGLTKKEVAVYILRRYMVLHDII